MTDATRLELPAFHIDPPDPEGLARAERHGVYYSGDLLDLDAIVEWFELKESPKESLQLVVETAWVRAMVARIKYLAEQNQLMKAKISQQDESLLEQARLVVALKENIVSLEGPLRGEG